MVGRDSESDGVWDRLARVRRPASCGVFVTDSGSYSTDKHRNGKRRAEETGGCVHAEGGAYGVDVTIVRVDRDAGVSMGWTSSRRRLFSDLGCEMQHTYKL